MLAFEENPDPALPTIELRVRDATKARALRFVLNSYGFDVVTEQGQRLVADSIAGITTVDVLVVEPTPAALVEAVGHYARGEVRTVVSYDMPDRVITALELLEDGIAILPAAATEAVLDMPDIDDRSRDIWAAVIAGDSDRVMASALDVAPITIKRAVAALCAAVSVGSRAELIAAGRNLGVRPRRLAAGHHL